MSIQNKKLTLMTDIVWDIGDDNVSLALMDRLKARIARRESRLKQVPFEQTTQEVEPNLLPAA